MAEATAFEPEQEGAATVEENAPPATEEANLTAANKAKAAEQREDDSDSLTRPLLRDESRPADVQTATDGADRATSDPRGLEPAGSDQAGCGGSVRSLCSDSSRRECPICSEPFDSLGDHRLTLLNCDHALCHRCTTGIMSQARDAGRLRCPFCRQSTPFPQWEIRRLQEESYSHFVYQPVEALVVGPVPELQDAPAPLLCCVALERHLEAEGNPNICDCCEGLRQLPGRSLFFCLSIFVVLIMWLICLSTIPFVQSLFFRKH